MKPYPVSRNPYLWLLVAALLGACILFTPGCSTFSKGNNLQRIQTAAKLAAMDGATLFMIKHPESRPAFVLARDQLIQIESSEHVDLALLLSIVNRLPVKELNSKASQLLIMNATLLISDFAGNLPVDKLDDLKPVAKALREGLDLALAQ